MITIEKEFHSTSAYPLSRLGNPTGLLFFDIETTGFSGDYNTVYLIGCVYKRENIWHFIQWFADSLDSESEVLEHFFQFAKGFHTLVHFNGDTFDIPFLQKRVQALGLSCSFDGLESFDIYKRIKPYKKHLGLSSMKQKAIEGFLGIDREDRYTGGQLIEVYGEYVKTKDDDLLRLLLLHNEDDLKGMPALLPILFYPDFFSQDFTLTEVRRIAGETPRLLLSLEGERETVLPVPLRASVPSYSLCAEGNCLELSLRLYEGTLKFFYPNYRDYYYLIYEDTAVHKSVGEFVDKSARIKATRETCYTKKSGTFLPQPTPLWTPDFRNSCSDKHGFFECSPDCFSDAKKVSEYARQVMKAVFTAR